MRICVSVAAQALHAVKRAMVSAASHVSSPPSHLWARAQIVAAPPCSIMSVFLDIYTACAYGHSFENHSPKLKMLKILGVGVYVCSGSVPCITERGREGERVSRQNRVRSEGVCQCEMDGVMRQLEDKARAEHKRKCVKRDLFEEQESVYSTTAQQQMWENLPCKFCFSLSGLCSRLLEVAR